MWEMRETAAQMNMNEGRMGGWADGRMGGWADGRMGGWADEQMNQGGGRMSG